MSRLTRRAEAEVKHVILHLARTESYGFWFRAMDQKQEITSLWTI